MNLDNIFEDKVRTDLDFANHLDDMYDFYDRSAKPEFENVRRIINEWFKDYPQSEKAELKSRFKKTFSPAFFELFIYQLFTNQGFTLIPHPKLSHTTKTPDFLAEKGEISFYIEAKEASDISEAEVSLNKKINTIYDAISKINSPDFWISINTLNIKSDKQPSGKHIIKSIEAELVKHKVDSLEFISHIDHIIIDNEDVEITITLLPKSPEIRGDHSIKPIGIYPMGAFWGGPDESIKTAIRKKASRYGNLDKPYLICINALSDRGVEEISVANALLGSLAGTWSTDPTNKDFRWSHTGDGLFGTRKSPAMTRVSGVFVTRVFPSNIYNAHYWLVKHPYTQRELDCESLDLEYKQLGKGGWQNFTGKTLKDILM